MDFFKANSFRAQKPWQGYAFAFGVTLIALYTRLIFLQHPLGFDVPFLMFYFSLTLAAWYGGFGPGLFATILGAVATGYHFLRPIDTVDTIAMILFTAEGSLISFLFEVWLRAETSLRSADRHKDVFVATVAHELRNPLSAVANAAEILRSADSDATRESAMKILDRQIRQMKQVVDDLTDTASVAQGKVTVEMEPVRLLDVTEAAVESTRALIKDKGHQLILRPAPAPVWVSGDAARLTQVVTNLLTNAAKYTDPGGIIRLEVQAEADEVTIFVEDNGIGIPRDMLPRIFGMFSQVDENSARGRKGLGIGLALVKKLVALHGGRVAAQSAGPGKGSRFTVTLPRIQPPVRRIVAERHQPAPAAASDSRRVLVVDDSQDSAQTLAWLVESLGCEAKIVHDGASALREAETYRPNVILLDIGLPGMDGYETSKELRRLPALSQTLIIAQTGYGQRGNNSDLLRDAGFDDCLIKPIEMDLLKQALHISR